MRLIPLTFFLVFSLIYLSACSLVQENEAFNDWQVEAEALHADQIDEIKLPKIDKTATLTDYILYARLNNSGLRAAFSRWKAALEKVIPARTLPDPRFNYTYYVREVETRVGPQQHKFGMSQTFPWFGKLDLQGKMALQEANAEQQRYEAEKLQLIYQVKNIYYEYWYLARSSEITEAHVSLVTHFEKVALAKYRSGRGLQSDLIKIQVELGKLKDHLKALKDMVRPVAAKLNFALNRSSASLPLPLPETENLPSESIAFSDENLKTVLTRQNPNLKAIDFMADKTDTAVQLAGKAFFPNMTLGVDYIDTDERKDMNPDDNGKDPVMAMVSVNVPIWHQKYNAVADEARRRHKGFLHQRKEKENILLADLEMALYKLRDADRKIDLYKNTLLPMVEQNVKVNQSAFTADKVGFLDLIDSQRVLLDFQLEYQRSRRNRAQSVAKIEMLTGQKPDFPQSGKDTKD